MTEPGTERSAPGLRSTVKAALPAPLRLLYWMLRRGRPEDLRAAGRFLAHPSARVPAAARVRMLERLYAIHETVTCAHTQAEALAVIGAILDLPDHVPGCVVEAGCYKGGSSAKFAVAAKSVGRRVVLFDSFEGLPDNTEAHATTLQGERPDFSAGKYRGALDEVRANLARFDVLDTCEFVPGWFDQTMPGFARPIALIYLDVDLVSSTRTCIKHLYPLLARGGSLFSQDGHLPLIVELLGSDGFWRDEVGCERPAVPGLGRQKLLHVRKADPAAQTSG